MVTVFNHIRRVCDVTCACVTNKHACMCCNLRCLDPDDAAPAPVVDLDIDPAGHKQKMLRQLKSKGRIKVPEILSVTTPVVLGIPGITMDLLAGNKSTDPLYIELTPENIDYLSRVIKAQIEDKSIHRTHPRFAEKDDDSPAPSSLPGVSLNHKKRQYRCTWKSPKSKKVRTKYISAGSAGSSGLDDAEHFIQNLPNEDDDDRSEEQAGDRNTCSETKNSMEKGAGQADDRITSNDSDDSMEEKGTEADGRIICIERGRGLDRNMYVYI